MKGAGTNGCPSRLVTRRQSARSANLRIGQSRGKTSPQLRSRRDAVLFRETDTGARRADQYLRAEVGMNWWNPLDKESRRAAFLVCHSLGLCWVRFW